MDQGIKEKPKSSALGKLAWTIILILSIAYLMNIGFGVFEIIPDNVPLIGNLDDAGAVLLLLKSLVKLNIVHSDRLEKLFK